MKYDRHRHRLVLKKILWRNPFHNLGYLKIAFFTQTTFLRTQQNKVIKKKERDSDILKDIDQTKW
jgi:hypothetical protein